MLSFFPSQLIVAALLVGLVSAQNSTQCNPLDKQCPPVPGLDQKEYTVNFKDGVPENWTMTVGELETTKSSGRFRINESFVGPTIASNFYIFFGYVEVTMQAAPGQGVVSTMVLESADLDEIDMEIIGSEKNKIQTNYFGKGNLTQGNRGKDYHVDSPQSKMHTYAIDWQLRQTIWYVDGKAIRTLNRTDALNGENYPQTPMNVRIGAWVAGQQSSPLGTITWAGGLANASQAPFDMYVAQVKIRPRWPCPSFYNVDTSGAWESIKCPKWESANETAMSPIDA